MHKIKIILLIIAGGIFFSCEKNAPAAGPNVVVSSVSLEALTRSLLQGWDVVKVYRIGGAQGTCDHDRSLSVQDLKAICTATTVVHNGEEFIMHALEKCPQTMAVNVAANYDSLRYFANGTADMHLWFSPRALDFQAHNIYATLQKLPGADSINSSVLGVLNANLAALRAQIQALQNEVAQLRTAAAGTPVAMFHEAYGYLLRELAMPLALSQGGHDHHAPSAKELGGWIKQAQNLQVALIFASSEDAHSQALTVAQATDIPMVTLALLTEEWPAGATPDFTTWATQYRANLHKIATALNLDPVR